MLKPDTSLIAYERSDCYTIGHSVVKGLLASSSLEMFAYSSTMNFPFWPTEPSVQDDLEADIRWLARKEAAQLWSQREGEWHREREARERLLSEVLAVRQKQIEACLEENRLRQAEDLHLRETLLADLESEVSGRSGGKALARHKAATQRRAELDAQLMEANLLQSREAEADRLETEAERAAEVEYEERLRYEANRLRRQHQQREASGKETSYNDYDNYADLSSLSLKDREGQELTEAVPYDSLICSGTRADKNYSTMRPLTGI
ncbi:unnamed protein product [Protopolystoma xenopodis]|uniref:Trichoplein keratin filament-binding protein n=1 Tax=Protopolystoma xenopodis TaxID=117903 RepID=A0A448XHC1_9PLAT|nr:unnamed protein product [Protopolystoma xenopodis]